MTPSNFFLQFNIYQFNISPFPWKKCNDIYLYTI